MSTQIRNSGGGSRNKNKPNHTGGGGGTESASQSIKKTEAKTEKEKVHPKPTAEQLRIAQITNNTSEDPQMREKVATLIEMTQRSEEEVCCALNECDNNLERAVEFLLEKLPVGAFETSSKKKKNKASNAVQEIGGGDGEWASDSNANNDKREKSRNRNSNRGGRGGTDSRGWRGREARENERNLRDSRGGGGAGSGGGDREDRNNENYRGPRRDGGGRGPGRGGGYAGRGGRGGGRMGRGPRGERGGGGGFNSRHNVSDQDQHQEVEVWDNSFAQTATEKQQQQQHQDDAWGDWDNEEYVGSLKDSKVFTTSNLPNQTAASVLSGVNSELTAPPGLEHHLGASVAGGTTTAAQTSQGSHLIVGGSNVAGGGASGLLGDSGDVSNSATSTTMMQYSAAVSSNQMPQQQQQQQQTALSAASVVTGGTQTQPYGNAVVDTFTNAATAAANLVQQAQQQQAQLKTASATLSAEQSQYFNSLASQGANTVSNVQQPTMATYAQSAAAMNYPPTFANVFGSGAGATTDQSQQQPQVRRARAKLPPPSKIPSTAVEMPGDTLNNVGYLDVQFGGLDFGNEESFDTLSEKFAAGVNIDGQQTQQEVTNEYQNKTTVQQQAGLTSGLQNSQITDSLSSASYAQRSGSQQQPQVVAGVANNNALDQLKNDPYNQTNSGSTVAYPNTYQANAAAKTASNAYQHGQGYNSASFANTSVGANTYQPQSYGVYQPNSYQQQQQQQSAVQSIATNAVVSNNGSVAAQSVNVSGGSTTQNIPVGGASNTSANSNSNTGYLTSGYGSQQSAYQSIQSVYGNSSLSSNTGYAGSSSNSASQYSNLSAKLKETSTTSSTSHYDSVSSSNAGAGNNTAVSTANVNSASGNANNNSSAGGVSNNSGSNGTSTVSSSSVVAGSQTNNNGGSAVSVSASGVSTTSNKTSGGSSSSSVAGAGVAGGVGSSSSNSGSLSGSGGGGGAGAAGMVPTNIQMVSQYIQPGMPYYQQQVYSYEDLQMMPQRVQHVPGYYDLNYTSSSLGAGRDNLGSVAYSTMTDGRFARTDNNSSPVSSTMSQQAGSSGPMLNVPYAAYFYGGNVMPGSFQYGTPAIYPQQIPAANTPSGGQFPKPSYNAGYNSTSYDTLSQASQDYTKGAYQSNVNQQTKSQNVTNQAQAGSGSDISSTMYGKGHVALNKVNSYEKQNFHSGTPPPFNMANTQTAGGTSAQPYGMYLPMPAAGHHNMIHQPMHQMDGRIHSSSRRDSNSAGQRQQTNSQSKSANKQGYTPSYWTGQN